MTFTPRAAILSCAAVATLCGMALAFAQASSKQEAAPAPTRKTAVPKQAQAPSASSRADAKTAAAAPADAKTAATTPAPVDAKTAAAAPPDAKTAAAAPADPKTIAAASADTKASATVPEDARMPAPPPGDAKVAAKATGAPPADPKAATDSLVEPTGFTYAIEGRRDPFISLLRRGGDITASAGGTRPSGLDGLAVGEITLRGTMRSHEGFVAILQGADQKAYIVRAGDRLADGTVRTISQNDMVIVQQVNDPLSLEKQREVRKILRQIEAN